MRYSWKAGAFAFYAPKLYSRYCEVLGKLFKREDYLQQNCRKSIFPAATFNLGPSTITLDHTDAGNVAYGWCALTALGKFDPKKGGHLILFDLGFMIQFPPGATILIPSSVLRHGNTPIGEQEHRMSLTQYCAGGLFRWVTYGFQSAKDVLAKRLGKTLKGSLDGERDHRTQDALALFSKIDELESDRHKIFPRRD